MIKESKLYKDWFTKEGWSFLFDVRRIKVWHIFLLTTIGMLAGLGGAILVLSLVYSPLFIIYGVVLLIISFILLCIWAFVFTKENWEGNFKKGKIVNVDKLTNTISIKGWKKEYMKTGEV